MESGTLNDSSTSGRGGVFRDARRILGIAEVTPGLPFPSISKDRAVFFYTGCGGRREAARAAADAREILGSALPAEFRPRMVLAGSTRHYILTALLPSGLKVEIVALAGHIDGQPARQDTPGFAAAAA